ncbi:fumarylacetoacetate hydrolase [Plasticicumulans lactativorans]|uniref:fumarylacetoacetase n=1 Tax=Plasticicumulans lactativorans TaxID=1133106 RepID=A0A4R2LGF4_9GAMM|nr:fumarylacetoacetase [Plasticicumulans lactativorans]TCO83821.1 fumarylacetoacetate hydrolase [Plasticicumulans lactativorans]
MTALNETHDPLAQSWVASANAPDTDFPLQNLPFGVFRRQGSAEPFRGGVAIGDQVVDLAALQALGVFEGEAAAALAAAAGPTLNPLMALGAPAASALRLALSRALRAGSPLAARLDACLLAQARAEYAVPAQIGDYTDFYTSIHHATNVGRLFRPDNPLLPNYQWVPIGYHGRCSSIGVSGQAFPRPRGQTRAPDAERPTLGPSRRLDYELELGVFIGRGNALGEPVPLDEAEDHVFGLCLFNDWSARDLQAWEYQPLGPFLSKNFASTLAPWIVTLEALAPYRVGWTRPAADPQPLAYLESPALRAAGAFDIRLEVALETAAMRARGRAPARLSLTSFRHAYWSVSQMVAHHTVNGCNLSPGDLLGSGTQSGPTPAEAGSLLELTRGGKEALSLPDGETRIFLDDGDTVILRGWCEREGYRRIGFGECRGTVLPARG